MKILIVTTKPIKRLNNKFLLPINVGSEPIHLMISDNTGENIHDKNENFCELTALYWAWKNLNNEDIVGMCHYRRYFDFTLTKSEDYEQLFSDLIDFPINAEDRIREILNENDIILPKKKTLGSKTIVENYEYIHNSFDWAILLDVLKEKYPKDFENSKTVFLDKELYSYNMFIAKKNIFDECMEWLFDILFEIEKRVVITNDSYQKRIFGFMSERLIHLFFVGRGYKIKELPIIMLKEKIEFENEALKKNLEIYKRKNRHLRRWGIFIIIILLILVIFVFFNIR